MLNALYDWLDLHTTDTILASLDKMVARLRRHAEKLNAQAIDAAEKRHGGGTLSAVSRP